MTKKIYWTEEQIKQISNLREIGLTIREIAERLGLTYKQVENTVLRKGLRLRQLESNKKLLTSDLKEYTEDDVEQLFNHVVKGQELVRKFDLRQREVFPEYKTNKYAGIVFHGDWHLEHYKTDAEALRAEIREIGAEEEVFYVHVGDSGDWADIRFPGYNLPSFIVPIELRYKLLFSLVSEIKNLLAIVSGCHDDWLKNRGFFDIIGALQQKANTLGVNTYYLGYGGTINFKIGQVTYRIAVYHKYGGESALNDFHPCVKYLQNMDGAADVVAIGHRHDKCGTAYVYYQHLPRVFVRSGSHQYLTDYAWKEGFSGAIAKSPMIILGSQEKYMKACPDYKQGLQELREMNKRVK